MNGHESLGLWSEPPKRCCSIIGINRNSCSPNQCMFSGVSFRSQFFTSLRYSATSASKPNQLCECKLRLLFFGSPKWHFSREGYQSWEGQNSYGFWDGIWDEFESPGHPWFATSSIFLFRRKTSSLRRQQCINPFWTSALNSQIRFRWFFIFASAGH